MWIQTICTLTFQAERRVPERLCEIAAQRGNQHTEHSEAIIHRDLANESTLTNDKVRPFNPLLIPFLLLSSHYLIFNYHNLSDITTG